MIPLAVFGPSLTVTHYQKWAKVLVGPALGAGVGDVSTRNQGV